MRTQGTQRTRAEEDHARREPAWRAPFRRESGRIEPMLVFALLGGALFALSLWLDLPRDRSIRISAAEVSQLRGYWQAQAQRAPTASELAGLIDERVDEEVLYREALQRGLDRDDVIVRRRLAQKLAFLDEGTAEVPAPDEATLRAYFQATRANYALPDTFTLRLVYFSPERRGATVVDAARDALHQLAGVADDASLPAGIGDPFMLPSVYADVTAAELARDFGNPFVARLRGIPVGGWHGPVESSLGVHLVQVITRRGASAPAYEAVAAQVRQDYIADARRKAHARWVAELRARYRIEVLGIEAPAK